MRDRYIDYLKNEETYLIQLIIGLLSICIGMFFAGLIIHLLPEDLTALEKARELGIIGKTVMDGYAKQSEIRYYITGVLISLLVGFSLYLVITYIYFLKNRGEPTSRKPPLYNIIEDQRLRMGMLRWVVLCIMIFLATYHNEFIYKNWYWGAWQFYFEEGIYLRWIDEMLRGGVVYKDVYLQGGPLMAWPQYWLMKMFGPSLPLSRYYIYFCYFLGYIIVFIVLREIVINRVIMIIGLLFSTYFYYPMLPGLQQSLGRFAFPLLPMFFLYMFFIRTKYFYLFISGVTLGLSLFSSQELGISALIACAAMLAAHIYREGGSLKNIFHQVSLIFAGILVPSLPILVYLYLHNALPGLYEAMIKMPKYYMLGLGNEFPNLFNFFNQVKNAPYDRIEILLSYWPIIIYILSAFFCLVLFLRKSLSNRHIFIFGITVLGGMIFLRAFGIYSPFKIKDVIYPLIILSTGYLDMAWTRVYGRTRKKIGITCNTVEALIYAVLFIFIASGFIGYSQRGFPGLRPYEYRASIRDGDKKKFEPLNINHANNIYLPPGWAKKTRHVVEYIKQNTDYDEPIFVFPYSPMYYFLTDRQSASKYPVIYAITKEYREQIVKELDDKKVQYIIHPHKPMLLIGMTSEERFPEITEYIRNNYRDEWRDDDTVILKRMKN